MSPGQQSDHHIMCKNRFVCLILMQYEALPTCGSWMQLLGWPKSYLGFFHTILWKHLNQLFGQLNIFVVAVQLLSCVQLFASPFILFMGFLGQEYWSSLPFPSPGDHILSEIFTMTHTSWMAMYLMVHSIIELCKPLYHNKAVIHERRDS